MPKKIKIMQLYNLYQDNAIKLYITPSRIIQLQVINTSNIMTCYDTHL